MARPLHIALVDDDPDHAQVLSLRLKRMRVCTIETTHYASAPDVLKALDAGAPADLVVLDLVMPGMDGLTALPEIRQRRPGVPIVMASAQSVVRTALEAIEQGADDYLVKGDDVAERLKAIVRRAADRLALVDEIARLQAQVPSSDIIGESAGMARVHGLISKAVRGDLPVAVLGESGSGKELIAHAIHQRSPRVRGPFVVVNCAAIPRELMESELFGHEKGSFTGAHARREGVFEQAHGGTLFLDEIGELDASLQAKLLRVLQDGTVRRVGGKEAFEVDVRVISATHRDIPQMVKDGDFREDLYYRLVQFPIPLPPLRERGSDVLLLADRFLAAYTKRHPNLGDKRLSPAARRALLAYAWPGNVRELKSTIERAALLSDDETLVPGDLGLGQGLDTPDLPPAVLIDSASSADEIVSIDDLKRRAVEHALRVCDGNIEETARRLGITRSTVYRLMKRFELEGSGQ
ncbi:MAG: sigma-54 dependent transcriptional regulator [Rubricoccaceae bacterium]